MISLDHLARRLGGVVRTTQGHHWLDTTVGELRAVVIRRRAPQSNRLVYDLAVFTPHTRELDPFHPHVDEWCLDGGIVVPRLRGYVFAGCRGGVLFASSSSPPSLEHIVATLWELGEWARKAWRPVTRDDIVAAQARERRRRRQRMVGRVGFVVGVALLAAILRRVR